MRRVIVGVMSAGIAGVLGLPALGLGCSLGSIDIPDLSGLDASFDLDASAPGAALRGVGGACGDRGGTCRPGLACTGGVCEPGRSTAKDAACVISAECMDSLYCGPDRVCAPAGQGGDGASCTSDGECKSGLRCNLVGIGAQCQPEGTVDVGGTCAANRDCFGGLLCAEKVCVPAPKGGPAPLGVPTFKGVTCEPESGPVEAYFQIPRGGPEDKDFFRLPYPNDVRKKNGRPDLTGFPTPGADLLGFDLVDRWARFVEQESAGFSAYPTVTFRFSGELDQDSLKTPNATRWIDLTPTTAVELGHSWLSNPTRSAYVCPNHVSMRPSRGAPLVPGHTYAVLLTNIVKAKGGAPVVVSKDLSDLLGATDPGGALSAGYAAYAPLRAWAAKKPFDLKSVINATVFTVGAHDDLAKKLAPAVQAAPAPVATSWVKCGTAPSPCAQAAAERACPPSPNPAFDELHALVSLPLFQKGTAPFLEPADGGGFVLDASGQPTRQGTAQVCMSLTVPTGTMPAGGWPLVIYAHGTGGSFRSHVTEGVAGRLSSVDGTKIAVLGIDQVGHGTRRGASTAAPQSIFFNFANPAASRGNVLQGAADQLALVRFAKGLSLTAETSPTGAALRFGRIAFWGHSQGATEGAVAMPYAADVSGAVFSGVGASLVDSLLTKKSPVNLAALAPAILSELPGNITAFHPALALFQSAIDPADPLDHAAALLKPGPLAKHVFVPYGQGDTYAPPATQLIYVLAAGLGVAQPPASVTSPDNFGRAPEPVPVSGNANGLTAVVRQYAPSGYDGHFVAFQNPDARTNTDRFLADAVSGIVPKLGR